MPKTILLGLICLLVCLQVSARASPSDDTLSGDLDHDRIADTLIYDRANTTIICKLSSQNFRGIKSQSIENTDEAMSGLRIRGDEFDFFNSWMRAGYICAFRYDKKLKKIRLIGMSREEFGNAANDGSGHSSVNLLTGSYIGEWNYYDYEKEKLISIPAIKRKMVFVPVFLEAFSDEPFSRYSGQCSEFFNQAKKKMVKISKRR